MLKNYIKIAWRNLIKNKIFSFINILGLSSGLTCCILISLYINHELSYDSFHKKADRIYQLGTIFIKPGGDEDKTANTPAPMGKTMQQEFPEIDESARLLRLFLDDKTLFQYTDAGNEIRSFYESNGYLADSTFFRVFSYSFKEGNPETALNEPNCIVISEEIAQKIFGRQPALNKVISIKSSTNGDGDYKVTGIFNESRVPSHIDARFMMSMKGGNMEQYLLRATNLANNNMFYTYLLLKPEANSKELELKFPAFIEKYAGNDLRKAGFFKKQFLTQLKDVHLESTITSNVTVPGSITYLYILGSIALFTLIIAVINFMNLSTARSSKRSAEVGIRKVLGAQKKSLIRLFLGESLLMSMIAFVAAIVLAQSLLKIFSNISGKDIFFSFQQHILLAAGFFLLAIITGLLAGSYPAFYLSSFMPVKTLKGKTSNSLAAASFRKVLVVFQFVISVMLIIGTVVISSQMNYINSKDLGFEKDQQIIISLRSAAAKSQFHVLKKEISQLRNVLSAAGTYYYPGIMNPSDMMMYKEGETINSAVRVYMNYVDEDYLNTLGIKSAAGRLFSKEFPADTNMRMIVNEEGIRRLGFPSPDKAIGRKINVDWQGKTYSWDIIGVVKNFHFQGLQQAIEPYGIQLNSGSDHNHLVVHAKTYDMQSTLGALKQVWQKLNPAEPFIYTFLDEDFNKNYESENRLSALVNSFTLIAIIISCLGLFGLAAFSAEQRTKEIGIRKVLGATEASIVALLSRDFLKLVVIAIVLSIPAAWYIMNQWLEGFAYRTELSWDIFVLAGITAILIALITISFQAIKAAVANPVKSLKYE